MMIMCLSILPSFVGAETDYKRVKFENAYLDIDLIKKANSNVLTKDKWLFYDFGNDMDLKGMNMRFNSGGKLPIKINYVLYDHSKKIIYDNRQITSEKEDMGDLLWNAPSGARYISLKVDDNSVANSIVLLEGYALLLPTVYEDVSNIEVSNLTMDSVEFTWKNPNSARYTGLKIFEGDREIAFYDKGKNSATLIKLKPNNYHTFKFVAIYGDKTSNGVSKSVRTPPDPRTIPPGPVTSLVSEPIDKTVKLKWKKPKDEDLAGFKILQDGKVIAEIGMEEEFTVKNLKPLTAYNFSVIAVDNDKNDSVPVVLTVKTLFEEDKEPPLVPTNVFVKPSNGALIASWDKVKDEDLAGYNVYVDDKKVNNNLINSTSFTIRNLENDKKYKVQVQAVDYSKNTSALSLPAYGTPNKNTIPVIDSRYTVGDVSDGVGTMFGQIWPILAFAVGIPLGFYIIYKLKQVILP